MARLYLLFDALACHKQTTNVSAGAPALATKRRIYLAHLDQLSSLTHLQRETQAGWCLVRGSWTFPSQCLLSVPEIPWCAALVVLLGCALLVEQRQPAPMQG